MFLSRTSLFFFVCSLAAQTVGTVRFGESGYTTHGEWWSDVAITPNVWTPETLLQLTATLQVSQEHLDKLAALKIPVDGFCLLVTAERTFDAEGRFRMASDERMSTLLTPTGLGIEGGVQGAVTARFGYYGFRTPVDVFLRETLKNAERLPGNQIRVTFRMQEHLPLDLPPGLYRVRLDYGVAVGRRYYSLEGGAFARRIAFIGRPIESHLYSPPVRASGTHVSGRFIDAETIQPRVPWVLMNNYNSNGYRGVVAEEDKSWFALSNRNLIPDDVILPLYSGTRKLSYSLEPQFPADTIELRSNIPWNFESGELSIQVTGPDGKTTDLGTAPFAGKTGQWPTTRYRPFTTWTPSSYGLHTVKATGWINDIWGIRYEGGGTYKFWIANRMTLATATFQGMSYPVGNRYGRDIGFAPAVPADVEGKAVLYVNSDPAVRREIAFTGTASPSGLFTAAQGLKPLSFDAPGEYIGHVLARYTDERGHLWVCSMRHAGVVYPEDSPIVARGKKLYIDRKYADRGDTNFEGWVDQAGNNFLAHINFPFQAGDVLLIASDGQGANKIEPVLTYEPRDNPPPYDARLNGIGITNLQMKTANGYSPHLFPEYITDKAYYYAGAPRPGFMSRFLVGEDGVRAPYWPTSPNSFGGQINASNNGDLPGDIYRLIGGVVVRKPGQKPLYAGYLASAFLLPRGSKNNRVIAAGAEDLLGSNGRKARFFLVGTRPGMVYETGTAFAPAIQIDPIVPATISFALQYPDGRRVVATGQGDRFGGFVGASRWTLDVPGVYKFQIFGDWQGHKGAMPGLPAEGGEFYVVENKRPADFPVLKLNVPAEATFRADGGLEISGTSTAEFVNYAAVIPGAVIAQGVLPVIGGRFQYYFDPKSISDAIPTYDIANRRTGAPEIRDVVHLTFFAKEQNRDGDSYHSFVRLILRGNTVLHAK